MPHFSMNIHKNTEHSRIFCIVPLQNSKSEIRKKLKPTLHLRGKKSMSKYFQWHCATGIQ